MPVGHMSLFDKGSNFNYNVQEVLLVKQYKHRQHFILIFNFNGLKKQKNILNK